MPSRAETLAEAARLRAQFEAAGAVVVETTILQPAELLLDLYGENIRGRAYVTSDALHGEQEDRDRPDGVDHDNERHELADEGGPVHVLKALGVGGCRMMFI